MNNKPLAQVGRVAMRVEGEFWNAYYARPESMEDAQLLASVRLALVADPDRKNAFIAFVRSVVGDIIEHATGARPEWRDPEVAPEHERSGRG